MDKKMNIFCHGKVGRIRKNRFRKTQMNNKLKFWKRINLTRKQT